MHNENEQNKEYGDSETQKEFEQNQESVKSQNTYVPHADKDTNNGHELSQKNKNERFIVFALIAGVVIVSVLVGSAMIFFYPAQNTIATTATTESLENEDSVSESEENDDGDFVIIYNGSEESTEDTENVADNDNVNDYSDNDEKSEKSTSAEMTSASASSHGVSERKSTQKTKKTSEPLVTETKPRSTTKSAAVPKIRKYKNNDTLIKPNVSPITKKQIPSSSVNNKEQIYWVQVFSTSNRNKAYSIKNEFEKRGITLVVITKTINSKLYYRLRIGPYYKKSEGNKFLQWVKKIDVYKDAYLTMNYI